MDNIHIGKTIALKRKEKGITQEELANYLGVSKPAVSKWESGQSYPDIMLLPVLASYFDITIDQLIGYEPQMTKEDIRKLYHKLADDFAKSPFGQVYEDCEGYIKKYFSCWYLQYQIALLYVNHGSLAGTPEKTNEILKRAIELFERVEKSCEDINLAKQALQLKALCYMSLQRPTEALDILEDMCEPQMQPESLLIKAYQMKGDKEKAIAFLQGTTYVNLINLISSASDYFIMYADQPDRIDEYYKIFTSVIELFEIEKLHPATLYNVYLNAAAVYVMQGRNNEALDVIEKYVNLAKQSDHGRFKLHGNDTFDALDKYFTYVDIETAAPRNAEVIWKDIINIIKQNPLFASLEQESRFQQLKRRLEES